MDTLPPEIIWLITEFAGLRASIAAASTSTAIRSLMSPEIIWMAQVGAKLMPTLHDIRTIKHAVARVRSNSPVDFMHMCRRCRYRLTPILMSAVYVGGHGLGGRPTRVGGRNYMAAYCMCECGNDRLYVIHYYPDKSKNTVYSLFTPTSF